jgi:glycosyltransferase involved in cell wall biosynthesis
MSNHLQFNIVIPTYNRAELLVQTLQTLFRENTGNFKVYVVNNGCALDLPDELSTLAKLTIINSKRNSPCYARNLAIQIMEPADYVYFCDDDLIFTQDVLSRAEKILTKMNIQILNLTTYKIRRYDHMITAIREYFLAPNDNSVDIISGGNVIIKYDICKKVLWPDDYIGYAFGEDVRYANLLKSHGYEITHTNVAKVIHVGDLRPRTTVDIKKEILGKLLLSCEKHEGTLIKLGVVFSIFLKYLLLGNVKAVLSAFRILNITLFFAGKNTLLKVYNAQ